MAGPEPVLDEIEPSLWGARDTEDRSHRALGLGCFYLVNTSLAELLQQVSAEPRNIIIHGKIADGVNRASMYRRKPSRADATGTIVEWAHRWLLLDIDSL